MPRHSLFSTLVLSSSLLLLSSFELNAKPIEPLVFTKSQSETATEIIETLELRHYRNQAFDDELSERYLNEYLTRLDPSKSYFFQTDIESFEQYKHQFDDMLTKGDLSAGFEIFHLYRERLTTRLNAILSMLDEQALEFDYSKKESLKIDREDAFWAKDKRESDEVWRKRLKSSLLSLKLSGKTLDEARETLKRRYNNQLMRVLQQDSQDAFEVLINALATLYDPHTSYLSPRTLENFNINMSLSLEGIGAVLQSENEYTKVVRLIAAGPADKQGDLKPADRIVAVGQGSTGELVDIVGWRLDEVVKLIRGPQNTTVRLGVLPVDEPSDGVSKVISINRDQVKLEEQAVKKAVFELSDGKEFYKLGVIDVPAFYIDFEAYRNRDPNFKSTTRDTLRLLGELESEGVDGIILDLRNNGGGSLQEATTLTDLFIDPGPVVQIRQSNQTISRHSRSRSRAAYRGPIIVLINRLSASASEIFAGAIQDYHRGLIVGSQSFGKGTVQSLTPLKEGQLKITESKFYRVSGDSTQHRGVIPDLSLPTIVNLDSVGESSYENALPWDQIHAVPHESYFDIEKLTPELKQAHTKRIAQDSDFLFLLEQVVLMKETNKKESVSLNEEVRRKELDELEQKSLVIENRRRKAKGLSTYDSVTLMKAADGEVTTEKKEATSSKPSKINPDKDPLLTETGYILIDFIKQVNKDKKPQVANF